MRLIDADGVLREIQSQKLMARDPAAKRCIEIIENATTYCDTPTAYDVDKAIKQLEAKKADCERLIMAETHDVLDKIQTETAEAFAMAYEEAIEIVKAGGKNETN